jgi:hypothetical protein
VLGMDRPGLASISNDNWEESDEHALRTARKSNMSSRYGGLSQSPTRSGEVSSSSFISSSSRYVGVIMICSNCCCLIWLDTHP